jgi:Taurine catabolism dioxygenase TauD, TfdA family
MTSTHGESLKLALKNAGWCSISPPIARNLPELIKSLGPLLPRGRGKSGYSDLKPYSRATAPPASMSAITGTSAQPAHTDGAYLPSPPRYVALQCLDTGEAPCPTVVWPVDVSRLQRDRPRLLTRAGWVARGGGHPPFYCSAMETSNVGFRLRFDPLCMRAPAGYERGVNEAWEILKLYLTPIEFAWERGSALVIDNWRCLHARGEGANRAPSRLLRRWTIRATDGLVV